MKELEKLNGKRLVIGTTDGCYIRGILTQVEYAEFLINNKTTKYPIAIVLDNDPEKGVEVLRLGTVDVSDE